MKTPVLLVLLGLSLAANAALFLRNSVSPIAVRGAVPSNPDESTTQATSVAGTSASPTQANGAGLGAMIESDDPKVLTERLRAAGFSPAMVRYIVAAKISEQFSARRRAILGERDERPFWQTGPSSVDAKTNAAMRQLSREQSAMLKEALGPAGMMGADEMAFYMRRQFGNLPTEKIEQLQRITGDYSDMRSEIYQSANGVMLPEDRAKLALIEKEQRADIAAVLTPAELEDYELRTSNTANQLRSQLAGFKPTEAEFRALFRATQAAEAQYGSTNAMLNPGMNPRQVRTAVLENAKSLLPPDRYAELQQATDPAYQTINRLIARLDLPTSVAPQVVNLQQDYMQRISTASRDRSLSPEQRNSQLSALQQEATQKLNGVLGERGLEAYRQNGGQWLQAIPRGAAVPLQPTRG